MGCLLLLSFPRLKAQDAEVYKQDSAWKAQQEYLNHHYIPTDEQDAFSTLEEIANEKGLRKFKNASEDKIKGRLHFGLGMWIMQNWGFYTGSRFSYYLNEKGLYSADDMVEYVIISFHRHLNNVSLESEQIIDSLNLIHKKEMEKYREKAKRIETLKRNEESGELENKAGQKR